MLKVCNGGECRVPVFDVLSFGAVGDGVTNDGRAIQRAIDACAAAGGGTVFVPAGKTYLSGTVRLASFVDLHVEGGAWIIASDRRRDYPNDALRCLIEAYDASGIALTGTGVIDGRAKRFMTAELPHIYRGNDWRPRLVGFVGCRGVTVRDITLADAANWALHPAGCEDVVISGVRILNDLKVPNCDGIDPDRCRNVRISDCLIQAGDDCICLKTSGEFPQYGPCENVTVRGCTLVSTSAAVKIGSGTVADLRDIVFDGCVIRASNRGLGIQLRDGGNVENVLFANMTVETRLFHEDWWGGGEPIYVTAVPREAGAKVGAVRNVRFTNILCRGEGGVFIAAQDPGRIENVLLENVRVEINKWTKWRGGRHDLRPTGGDRRTGISDHRTAGFYVERAEGVTLRNCEVAWGANRPHYFGHALEAHSAEGLAVENFRGEAAHPDRDASTFMD
jgi:hypothetical protein